jgi:hypothetical protein
MPQSPQVFREFGIIPDRVEPPPQQLRAYFSWGHIVGQYIATGLLVLFGLGIAVLFAFTLPLPLNILAALVALSLGGGLACLVGRNDYMWVELDGHTIRAKHLYTGRITERSIDEIDHLQTLVLQVQNLTTMIVNVWLGRVRGIMLHFRDKRWPIMVSRVDPKMTNAQQLMEAIVYRMSERGEIDAEVIDFRGTPLIRRIYWKQQPPAGNGVTT